MEREARVKEQAWFKGFFEAQSGELGCLAESLTKSSERMREEYQQGDRYLASHYEKLSLQMQKDQQERALLLDDLRACKESGLQEEQPNFPQLQALRVALDRETQVREEDSVRVSGMLQQLMDHLEKEKKERSTQFADLLASNESSKQGQMQLPQVMELQAALEHETRVRQEDSERLSGMLQQLQEHLEAIGDQFKCWQDEMVLHMQTNMDMDSQRCGEVSQALPDDSMSPLEQKVESLQGELLHNEDLIRGRLDSISESLQQRLNAERDARSSSLEQLQVDLQQVEMTTRSELGELSAAIAVKSDLEVCFEKLGGRLDDISEFIQHGLRTELDARYSSFEELQLGLQHDNSTDSMAESLEHGLSAELDARSRSLEELQLGLQQQYATNVKLTAAIEEESQQRSAQIDDVWATFLLARNSLEGQRSTCETSCSGVEVQTFPRSSFESEICGRGGNSLGMRSPTIFSDHRTVDSPDQDMQPEVVAIGKSSTEETQPELDQVVALRRALDREVQMREDDNVRLTGMYRHLRQHVDSNGEVLAQCLRDSSESLRNEFIAIVTRETNLLENVQSKLHHQHAKFADITLMADEIEEARTALTLDAHAQKPSLGAEFKSLPDTMALTRSPLRKARGNQHDANALG